MKNSPIRGLSAIALAGGCSLLVGCPTPPPPDDAPRANVRVIASGLASPVAMVAANDGTGRLFVADQTGFVSIIDINDQLLPTPFLDLRDRLVTLNANYDERGLLGFALHPNFATNGLFYVYYSPSAAAVTRLCEFLVDATDPNRADPLYERFLLDIPQPQNNHNGGQLAFGPDGFLYIGSGDGGEADDKGAGHTPNLGNGQDRTTLLGKILRIDVDTISGAQYAIPLDNPFVTDPNTRPEIFAYGLRNPWKFSFDTDNNGASRLFVADVGQANFEEVNIVIRGDNLGWYFREGAGCFDPDSVAPPGCMTGLDGEPLIDPIIEYPHADPSDGSTVFGLSVIGGYVYRGAAIADLQGRYVFGDYTASFLGPNGRIFVATEADDGSWTVEELLIANRESGRIDRFLLGFGMDEAGELYALASGRIGPAGNTGVVLKFEPTE